MGVFYYVGNKHLHRKIRYFSERTLLQNSITSRLFRMLTHVKSLFITNNVEKNCGKCQFYRMENKFKALLNKSV